MKIKNDSDVSFFLYLQYSSIHTTISDEVLKVYDNFSKEYFKNRKLNEQRYDREFKKAEDYLTNILEKINSLGLDKNSLILIMSDHGISVGERFGERAYGAFCYDYTIKTFANVIYPDVNPIEITQQVRTIDFMPTILDYLKIKQDKNYENPDGESLLPLMDGKLLKEKIAYSETGNPLDDKKPPKEPNTKSVRTSKWKLIMNEYNNTQELYDLENDPDEKDNVIGKYTDIEKMLLNEFLRIETKDTLTF
jgi:arylsulfatase A-like enzyme